MIADISVEVVFFLVAAIIALVNKLYEKSREIRATSQRRMKERDQHHGLGLVRAGAEVVEAPPAPKPPVVRKIAVRPPREPQVPPPRRTRRVTPVVPVVPVVPSARPEPVHRTPSPIAQRLRDDPTALREAIVLREVLGPPVAMRGFRFPRR